MAFQLNKRNLIIGSVILVLLYAIYATEFYKTIIEYSLRTLAIGTVFYAIVSVLYLLNSDKKEKERNI